ncbi:Nvj3p [Sporobolomyces koalae]|uniref:Nvj3p n=1 Tax=Sporobolomyces koalae TaxID=500713 RepID=UPI00316CC6B9
MSRSAANSRRKSPQPFAPASSHGEPSHAAKATPLYHKILYPANGAPASPPRILHSSSHARLDPLILDLIALSLRAFIAPWYNAAISRDPDKHFLQAVTTVLIRVIQALEVRLASIDWTQLVLEDLPSLLENHYRDWDLACEKAQDLSTHNFSRDEMFHRLQPHIAISLSESTGSPQVDPVYLRALVDHLLKILLPPEDHRAETERAIVREVLVGVVFGSVFGKVAQPWFLHGVIARVLEAREVIQSLDSKGPSTSSNLPFPTLFDQAVSALGRTSALLSAGIAFATNLVVIGQSTPHADPSRAPFHSHLFSLALAVLPRSATVAQLSQYLSLPLDFASHSIDSFLARFISTSIATEQTARTVLEGATRGMFPNDGWPAPKDPDPDEQGRKELEERCEAAVAHLIPDKLASLFYAQATRTDSAQLRFAAHLLRPFSSHVANVHLFVHVLDLLVGRLFPELVDNPEE